MLTNRNFSDLFHRTRKKKNPKKVRLSADFCLFSRFGIGPSIWLAQYKASYKEFHKSLTIIRRDLSPKNEETLFMNIYTYTYQGQLTDHHWRNQKGRGGGVVSWLMYLQFHVPKACTCNTQQIDTDRKSCSAWTHTLHR